MSTIVCRQFRGRFCFCAGSTCSHREADASGGYSLWPVFTTRRQIHKYLRQVLVHRPAFVPQARFLVSFEHEEAGVLSLGDFGGILKLLRLPCCLRLSFHSFGLSCHGKVRLDNYVWRDGYGCDNGREGMGLKYGFWGCDERCKRRRRRRVAERHELALTLTYPHTSEPRPSPPQQAARTKSHTTNGTPPTSIPPPPPPP